MSELELYVGQDIAKDCVAGDRAMNRYAIFNGLMYPRRIDQNLAVTILGVEQAQPPTLISNNGAAGSLEDGKYYSYKAVYASSTYLRPIAVSDGSGNFTRGNPSTALTHLTNAANLTLNVTVPTISQAGITHIFLYRSLGASSEVEAEAGPFYYVAQLPIIGDSVNFEDGLDDGLVGIAVETDNFKPNAYCYAINAFGYIFAGGNYQLGSGYTCTVTPGSSTVTISDDILYDGVKGWVFKLLDDTSGGSDSSGVFYTDYVDAHTLMLVDSAGTETTYDGPSSGAGQTFMLYLPGYALRWSKNGEPEAWPTENLINFDGDITGIAMVPNQPLLVVCTDSPSIYVLDITLIGTTSFKTNRRLISSEYTVSSHYSLLPVEGRLRGVDGFKGCIIEVDGVSALNISKNRVPEIFKFLTDDISSIKNWHCAYDSKHHLFGAFVTFKGAHRTVDFCIGQHTITGEWFFNHEKDLLCSASYKNPETGEVMVLGGTQGISGGGGVWGRIWSPNTYDEWLPSGYLRSGTLTDATETTLTLDNTDLDLYTGGSGLQGRWVLVCTGTGEYAQLVYIKSNTVNVITVDSVFNGLDAQRLSPVPTAGWLFYLGLIEMRWGPRIFDFGDPDVLKKIWEVWCTVENHNEDDPPFIRLYRGFETGYASQLTLKEAINLDRTTSQSLVNSVDNKLEAIPRWSMAWYDRSYGPTQLHSMTVVFNPSGTMVKR